MSDKKFDDHTTKQMALLVEELNSLQLKYDTRLLAAILAGRAGMLHGIMITGKVMTQEEARAVWKQAGLLIENPSKKEPKIMHLYGDTILDPRQIN